MSKVAVTGATGMIGRRLIRHLTDAGLRVHGLARDPSALASMHVAPFAYELGAPIDPAALEDVGVLIHAAATTTTRDAHRLARLDVEGARQLFERARAGGVKRIVFLSSTSAAPDAPGAYGRAKSAIEQLLGPDDVAIRLGLVASPDLEHRGGLFGRMVEMTRRARFVPLIDGGRQPVQPIHVDDACDAIVRAMRDLRISGVRTVAGPTAVSLRGLLEAIARRTRASASGRGGFDRAAKRPIRFLTVPAAAAIAIARIAETLRVPFPITADNVRGLVAQRFAECADDLAEIGVEPRSLDTLLDDVLGPIDDDGDAVGASVPV